MPSGAKQRRLAYFTSIYPALSMTFVLREIVELRRQGLEIDVVSINEPDRSSGKLSDLEREEAASTHYIKAQGLLGALGAHLRTLLGNPFGYFRGLSRVLAWSGLDLKLFFYHLLYFTEALMVGGWMRARRHTHLHVHLGNAGATVGVYVKKIFGCGLSITIHGPDEFYESRRFLLREKSEAADFIVCISHFARSQMMLLSDPVHWHKFVVCRLGVDVNAFPRRLEPPAGDGALRVLCLGRLTPAKGQHILLDAVRELRSRGQALAVNVIGDGPDRRSLEARARELQIADVVTFVGPVNPDHVHSWYARSDVFVLPSFAEGIPVVLMEAMAMGVPVISTTVAGIPELIRSGTDGLLVAPSDAIALATALEQLGSDAQLRARYGSNSRGRIESDYELRANVAKLADCFRERVAAP
jgi:colanic acid/amylovoran biosynthesis glycosyltransferase